MVFRELSKGFYLGLLTRALTMPGRGAVGPVTGPRASGSSLYWRERSNLRGRTAALVKDSQQGTQRAWSWVSSRRVSSVRDRMPSLR